jgi:integrase
MRRGEILKLQWAHVDLARRTLTILEQKNGTRDTLPVNDTAMAVLLARAAVWLSSTDAVFVNGAGHSRNAHNLLRAFYPAMRKAGIARFRFHDLRHTCATRMVQAGVDLYKVQRLLGHKSPIMTQRYAHHYPESLRDGVETLDVGRAVSTNLAQ